MTRIKKMSPRQVQVILYGTDQAVRFSYESQTTDSKWQYTNTFSGVIPNLNKNFVETDSESKREDLRKFMRETPCNSCRDRRLKDEALSVRINEKSIKDVCDF